ncbi:MAG: hypothetical protein QOJ97_2920 [Solirubrobacteraceae bacterium]|jgi:hypothetical protein|nr:hypothetical protein [Solirubrobacteraceae bacterium]
MRRPAASAAVVAAIAATGCGQRSGEVKPVGHESAGSVVQFADCSDWRRGSRAERMVTIVRLRGQLTPQRSKTAASPLRDERAYALIQKACTPAFAGSLRLYKLYVRMQGFAPLSEVAVPRSG